MDSRDGDAAPGGSVWQERCRAASAALDDTAALTRIATTVERAQADTAPTAYLLGDREGLATARRIGLFSGSFNPLTTAHVALARAAWRVGKLDVLVWACTATTIDKERVSRASLVDRLAQMQSFAQRRPAQTVALLNRGLYVEQATALRALLAPEADLALVIGFDKVVQIFDPRYYADRDAALDALFARARLLVGPRAGTGPRELAELLGQPENAAYRERVSYVPLATQFAGESSTRVRELAAHGERGRDQHEEMERLVTPEGAALAQTGAYAATGTDAADRADVYVLRQAWVRALASVPALAAETRMPPLSDLVAAACAADGRGAALRTWLLDEQWGDVPAEVFEVLRRSMR